MNITKQDLKEDFVYGLALAVLFMVLLILSPYMIHPVAFTGSMEPTLTGGDLLIVDETATFDDVEEDDIILFESQAIYEGEIIAHRVTLKTENLISTKGDNNDVHDRAYGETNINDDTIEGKVVYVIPTSRLIPF